MARNVEIKARVTDKEQLIKAIETLATSEPQVIHQDDTFFRCSEGRFKLRQFTPDKGELIFYQRANQTDAKASFYQRTATACPAEMCQLLTLAYGDIGRVIKQRWLYWIGRTRVHVDEVAQLGDFMELEVVLEESEPIAHGQAEARQLMQSLAINERQLIDVAYVDLIYQHEPEMSVPRD